MNFLLLKLFSPALFCILMKDSFIDPFSFIISTGGDGATHAGSGGKMQNPPVGDKPYGSVTIPFSFGSGNGRTAGGGIIHIKANSSIRIDGLITTDGAVSGGSGGSIYLSTSSFSGQGVLSAKGGIGNDSYGNSI